MKSFLEFCKELGLMFAIGGFIIIPAVMIGAILASIFNPASLEQGLSQADILAFGLRITVGAFGTMLAILCDGLLDHINMKQRSLYE